LARSSARRFNAKRGSANVADGVAKSVSERDGLSAFTASPVVEATHRFTTLAARLIANGSRPVRAAPHRVTSGGATPLGESSSPSPKRSRRSECATKLTSVSRYDFWY
jgi:hypothetical protein